jgi:hypothetical protein
VQFCDVAKLANHYPQKEDFAKFGYRSDVIVNFFRILLYFWLHVGTCCRNLTPKKKKQFNSKFGELGPFFVHKNPLYVFKS